MEQLEETFIKIYDLYADDCLRLAVSFTKSLADAEDIVQKVFIKLYSELNNNLSRTYNKSWLLKVTANESKNFLKHSWHKRIIFHNELLENKEGSNIHIDEISECLLKLPEKYRIVIYLYYYEGYKIKEIAEILSLNEENVRTRLRRGKEKMKIILGGVKIC